MNFLGIGPFELLLVLIIATIVLGPERMAQAGRTLGRLYAQYRLRWQKDVDEMTRELRRELMMLQQEVEEIRQTADSEMKAVQSDLEKLAGAESDEGVAAAADDISPPKVDSRAEPPDIVESSTPAQEVAPTETKADEEDR